MVPTVQELCCTTLFGPERSLMLAEYLKLLRCSTFNVCRFQYPKESVLLGVLQSASVAVRRVVVLSCCRLQQGARIADHQRIEANLVREARFCFASGEEGTHRQADCIHLCRSTHTYSSNRATVWLKPH